IFENKDLNNFKNSLEKLNDSNDDEAVFSQVFNIDDE
ncbi:MAG: CvpA family protein, partial [Rickettsia endosymbiont of Ixodes persulcatus]|nr:CvpA family protein [Rickettsia endosymbiont of Ixodes persulcatus]